MNKAIELEPNYSKAYFERASVHSKLGQYTEAIRDYNILMQLEPNNSDYLVLRGITYYNLGLYNNALVDLIK